MFKLRITDLASLFQNGGGDRPGPRPWPGMPLFSPVQPRPRGCHKNWPGMGLNFKSIYRIFRRIRRPLKCKNALLKIGVVSYDGYKSHVNFYMKIFFIFDEKCFGA